MSTLYLQKEKVHISQLSPRPVPFSSYSSYSSSFRPSANLHVKHLLDGRRICFPSSAVVVVAHEDWEPRYGPGKGISVGPAQRLLLKGSLVLDLEWRKAELELALVWEWDGASAKARYRTQPTHIGRHTCRLNRLVWLLVSYRYWRRSRSRGTRVGGSVIWDAGLALVDLRVLVGGESIASAHVGQIGESNGRETHDVLKDRLPARCGRHGLFGVGDDHVKHAALSLGERNLVAEESE